MSNSFEAMGLLPSLCTWAAQAGMEEPTPIQQAAIPAALAGKDILAIAPTGTGKTAAYALPMLQQLLESKRAQDVLVMVPTRELALQTARVFRTCLGLKADNSRQKADTIAVVPLYGGADRGHQAERLLHDGPRVLIATPGRLLDFADGGEILLASCTRVVMDEGDRLFSPEFFEESAAIVSLLPPVRQTLFFSATLPDALKQTVQQLLRRPEEIRITRSTEKRGPIRQGAVFVEPTQKTGFLRQFFMRDRTNRAIVFVKTKAEADLLAATLKKARIQAAPLHADLSQAQRNATVASYAEGKLMVLVATDIAARGLDLPAVKTVVNYDPPDQPEAYLHRIGRTGRAGQTGSALTLCAAAERKKLRQIELGASVRLRILSQDQALPDATGKDATGKDASGQDAAPRAPRSGKPAPRRPSAS
ncbi:DEAD/DEAH box helicase [Acetobacter persici]|uniref:DEAD/DEAH box helicase n=1 Tax=Acetobacter persici TaxID=1076596 RepID=UPI001BA8C55C|nr:DEAD/DEAH box helicase [Acetobacter persici]MBS1015081.1 DEAD/DEAH box helicase [Acetobacter persici]